MSKVVVHLIAAARPNFMKVAPLYHALAATTWAQPILIHTGQHYDRNMSDAILEDLQLPTPHFQLGVGSGTHAEQTGHVMIAYERVCLSHRPDWIIVVGDVNSTAACAIVGAKLWIPVIHLEAGLRSRDRRMPEEINRLLTDAISDVLWTPSEDANRNLISEGVMPEKIDLIGNIMIDSFEMLRGSIDASDAIRDLNLEHKAYAVVTLHRPSNVDSADSLAPIMESLIEISKELPIIFVAHPRTVKKLQDFSLIKRTNDTVDLRLIEPMPYIRFMNVVTGAKAVITDSGGLQEETTYLGIPCLTLRENTERPITITLGTNRLTTANKLRDDLRDVVAGRWPTGNKPPLWDGKTAQRAVDMLRQRSYQLGDRLDQP